MVPSHAAMLAGSKRKRMFLEPLDPISESVSLELSELALNSEQLQMM